MATTEKDRSFNTYKNAESWLKKQIPEWDSDRILLCPKEKYGQNKIVIVSEDRKLKIIEVYYSTHSLRPLITKLREYFQTGRYDDNRYMKMTANTQLEGYVLVVENDDDDDENSFDYITAIRKKYGDCGFSDVDKAEPGKLVTPEDLLN